MYKSSNFRPNVTAWLSKADGYDVRGRATFGDWEKVGISIVRFEIDTVDTSIRADKSGSKSRASEKVQIGRILVEPGAEFAIGDKIKIDGMEWEIDSKFPRYDQVGRKHHYQVDLSSWV